MKKIIAIVLLLLMGCTATNEIIEIGSILILTGEGSSWGIAARNGINLAVEEINAAGGINGKMLAVDHQDDKSDPKEAVTAFQNLNNKNGLTARAC